MCSAIYLSVCGVHNCWRVTSYTWGIY